jgi:hypothetical protein
MDKAALQILQGKSSHEEHEAAKPQPKSNAKTPGRQEIKDKTLGAFEPWRRKTLSACQRICA